LWALESWEEFSVEKSGFGVFELLGNVSRKTEIWVLVYCTRDQAWDVGYFAKDVGERIGE